MVDEEVKQKDSFEEQQDMEPNHKDASNEQSKYKSPETLLVNDLPILTNH